jgi:outer membrane protein assembly factor BamB/predicted MPP superfamily phosphohydrolase
MKTILSFVISLFFSTSIFSQTFKFAFLSDTHIGVKNADEDLRATVADINADTTLKFAIITGDITELGTDEEMLQAKKILSKLNKPLYIQTGNHDGNWSPNGGRIFNALFGPGRFAFEYNGYLFIGTNSGPNMHHKAPGQVPREDIIWMDSVLNAPKNRNVPVIYTNHYPQDSSQRNWFEVMDRLKQKNIQLILVGHGHLNTEFVFEGIPGIMGRSNLRAIDSASGYNIVSFASGQASFVEKRPSLKNSRLWAEAKLFEHNLVKDTVRYPRPSFGVNSSFANVKELWNYQNKFDVGSGTSFYKNLIIATNTGGFVYALNEKDGKIRWSFPTKGKIYSTPVISSDYLVVASTDSNLYCLNASEGKLVWKYKASKPVVASPVIDKDILYVGSSDGTFRALSLSTGKIKWEFGSVKDFVMTKPLIYKDEIFFGSWGSEFYSLNFATGKLSWKWTDTSNNRMFSPAGCQPVAAHGRVFIVAPDQYMTAFEAATGRLLWRSKSVTVHVRESMGLAADNSIVYVKTTDGKLCGISTTATGMQPVFLLNLQLGYDICASPIVEKSNVIYVPSNSGVVTAVDATRHQLLWKHKVSNSNITSIMPIDNHKIIVSSEDGKITCLQINSL